MEQADQYKRPVVDEWGTYADTDLVLYQLRCVAWSPDGKLIASADTDGKVYLWKASDGNLIASYVEQNPSYLTKLPVLRWSPEGNYLALDAWSSALQVWNVLTNATKLIPINSDLLRATTWLPDGRIALIDGSRDTQYIEVTGL